MLGAQRLKHACPQCRAQILRRLARGGVAGSTRIQLGAAHSYSQLRALSTTRRVLQEVQTSGPQASQDEIEVIVRQAKATFGDTLPPDYLSAEEYKVYERLFGPPLRQTRPQDVGIPFQGESGDVVDSDLGKNALLRETGDGTLEEVEYHIEVDAATPELELEASEDVDLVSLNPPTPAQVDYINAVARNKREYDALVKLQSDFEAASLRAEEKQEAADEEEEIDEEIEEDDEDLEDEDETEPGAMFGRSRTTDKRLHPLSVEGQFRTSPTTLQLPKVDFVEPITELLKRADIKHVRAAAEKAFGGRGLPHSPATPKTKHNHPQKGLALEARHHKMTEIEADAFIATALPGIYSSAMSVLVEVRKRLGSGWIQGLMAKNSGNGPRVLDVGGGGAGLAAWNDIFHAEWEALRERGEAPSAEPPEGKKSERVVVVGSDALRHRVSRFLHNTTFIPRLPDHLHSPENVERHLDAPADPQPRKKYDIIIASHSLMPLDRTHKRRELIANLWAQLNAEGGVLIVLEKGHPRGFEAVADARQRILDDFITSPAQQATASETIETDSASQDQPRDPGMIIAPCTNHAKCPMYLTPGLSPGRKDFCHFSQRFIRPPFLQRILDQTHRNHEDIDYSYVAIQRGMSSTSSPEAEASQNQPIFQGKAAADLAFAGYEKAEQLPNTLSLPRNVLSPIKRHGHVILDLCTPAGHLERWTVPKSLSKQAYHDARKARWGDLWALGAKTRVSRPVRLGRKGGASADGDAAVDDGGVRAQRAAKSGKRSKPRVIELIAGREGITGATEKFSGGRLPSERRTKGGKKAKVRELMAELEEELDEDEDEDFREIEEGLKKLRAAHDKL